ncbi:hypothetical protein DUNSADRAFT_4002 [Dunaliella salina]|uniref:Encoded protein n=1 Tax=Dunaliella salina TaxID=3046 RepID=A0ABQ7FV66_DUNSA|nr:hypothetical protein DUNSADRAFT_4002 [Dunaliella salina]|eukprot:KAF5826238.1 hypothetical protein DUNSADRAFT_4002 [Dunaliella salina]
MHMHFVLRSSSRNLRAETHCLDNGGDPPEGDLPNRISHARATHPPAAQERHSRAQHFPEAQNRGEGDLLGQPRLNLN